MLTVCKFYIIGSSQTRLEAVRTHATSEFVVSPVLVFLIFRMYVEISDGWVMRGVFTINLSSIFKVSLESLSENRIEWLILACTDIETAQSESNNVLESFKVII
jgi:hypothetical protein